MEIEGWAFTENESERQKEYQKRYQQIKDSDWIKITGVTRKHEQNTYHGIIQNSGVSHFDIALICDKGDVPFGADVKIMGNKFICNIWTN